MQTLFAHEMRGENPEKILECCLKEAIPKISEKEFAKNLLSGVLKKKKEIRKMIETHAPDWPYERIAPIDRACLEIGVYELMWEKEMPPLVAINEAVEIAKEFGDANAKKFVNGVLSALFKK
ncbi:transcription antitermination factor NusB [Candidatus Peregrinibacteria bacterium]|nr:transcription antitermination factor NusB [Candidatus Peregrinibacteria bacterium]